MSHDADGQPFQAASGQSSTASPGGGQSSTASPGEGEPRSRLYPEPPSATPQSQPTSPLEEVAGPQTAAGVTREPAPPTAPAVLDAAQRELLRAVLNRIVPAHQSLPGAGDLGVGDSIERSMAASIPLRRLFLEGLGEIGITAHLQAAEDFRRLDAGRQTAVLVRVEQRLPAFFAALGEHTYRGYYTLEAVQHAVDPDARPPQPLGHELPGFNPDLLDRQRQRAPFWRPVE
jgi:hypothetical protein